MSEQSAQHERTTNGQPEHLTFAEAGERLNISADAVRMRVKRDKLASVHLNDRTFVVWPQSETYVQPNEPRTEHVRSDVQDDSRLVAALEAHIAGFLERLPEVRELAPGDILDVEECSPTTLKISACPQGVQNALGRVDTSLRDD